MRVCDISGVTLGFTRLALNGLGTQGMQPMKEGRLWWVCNGEIYNWKALAEEHDIEILSGSDCEVLGKLYMKIVLTEGATPSSFFRMLDGVFAMIIVDTELQTITVGRDPYGVRPLFVGQRWDFVPSNTNNTLTMSHYGYVFASEIKAIFPFAQTSTQVTPGTYSTYSLLTHTLLDSGRYHTVQVLKNPLFSPQGSLDVACMSVRSALEAAVKKRMMTERPCAALLSGGLDSSLIASLVAKELRLLGKPPLKTFSIGMAGSSDLIAAAKVAEWIGSDHHEIVVTEKDFLAAIPSVIFATETYDTTTIRASVGNWLVAKEVAKTDCKVVFNGDGSDEVFGSYLYFNMAPHDAAYEEEVSRLLTEISQYDVLRSDRCVSAHGLEPRTPFLDKQFVATARSVATCWLRPVLGLKPEKWLLRRAFDDGETLPHEILWRRKEAFSDGVSSQEKSWSQVIQEKTAEIVPENWEARASIQYPMMTPTTTEQYYYRTIFETNYGKSNSFSVLQHFWMPKWSPGVTDPSARALAVY
jgi:asparagine synthase (glutamine-hydrolysing)